jgi:CRP-like cAMP-binding protein
MRTGHATLHPIEPLRRLCNYVDTRARPVRIATSKTFERVRIRMNNSMPVTRSIPNQLSPYPYTVVRGALGSEPAQRTGACTLNNGPLRNHLLAGLPMVELNRLLTHLERVEMSVGDVIYQYGSQSRYVYFPATSIVSLVYEMEDGASSEVAIVGSEGMVGVWLLLAGESMPGLAAVQCGGHGYRLCSRILKEECDRSKALHQALLHYTQALLVEIAQNAACSRHHSISSQLCRYLLRTTDRASGDEIALTHEMIADSLGVRRECITVAAGKLRKQGLIDYKRGHITVLDRQELEAQSCECYGIVRQSFERLLGRRVHGMLAGRDPIAMARQFQENPERRLSSLVFG